MLDDFFEKNPGQKIWWDNNVAPNYNFTDGIPKSFLFVKLDPDASEDRRNFVANGLRGLFDDDFTFLIQKSDLVSSLTTI